MSSWPGILPIWRIEYTVQYNNSVTRTSLNGKRVQRKISKRASEIVEVSLVLFGAQLPVFEYFVQVILNEGQDIFTGYYISDGVVKTGNIRIVGGQYQVQAITRRDWQVNCQIEVLRD